MYVLNRLWLRSSVDAFPCFSIVLLWASGMFIFYYVENCKQWITDDIYNWFETFIEAAGIMRRRKLLRYLRSWRQSFDTPRAVSLSSRSSFSALMISRTLNERKICTHCSGWTCCIRPILVNWTHWERAWLSIFFQNGNGWNHKWNKEHKHFWQNVFRSSR